MQKIAVFDLNKTLYHKSSKEEFFKYICYRQEYKLVHIFRLTLFVGLAKLHAINQTQFKENFFRYLNNIPPEQVEEYAREFWSIEYPRYFNQELLKRIGELRREGVRIALLTGALEIYVRPLLQYIDFDCFSGTQTKYEDGIHHLTGEANKEEEKLRRLDDCFGKGKYVIVEAYSDDKEAMLKKAERAFIVEDGQVKPLEEPEAEEV